MCGSLELWPRATRSATNYKDTPVRRGGPGLRHKNSVSELEPPPGLGGPVEGPVSAGRDPAPARRYRSNFLNLMRCGSTAASPRRRFLSSS